MGILYYFHRQRLQSSSPLNIQREVLGYETLLVRHILFRQAWSGSFLPLGLLISSLVVIVAVSSLIVFHARQTLESSFITTSVGIFFFSFLFLITTNARTLTEASQDYLLVLHGMTKKDQELIKYQVNALRPFRVYVGHFFKIQRSSLLTISLYVVDHIMTVLVSITRRP
jgi:hypothetical protein